MSELHVALYVYDDEATVEVECPDVHGLYRLDYHEDGSFESPKDRAFKTGTLSLKNGVWGWHAEVPFKLTIDGRVTVVCKGRDRGKDPWPTPPPPPPSSLEIHKEHWDAHALGPDQWFMSPIALSSARGSRTPAPRRRTTRVAGR